tara:strand:+ start:640 stop:849 length:210 start_codon:yes stop_codon:yes gene_type:complete
MARPTFEKKQGEPPAALHLNLKQSQWQRLDNLAHDQKTTKANLVRTAVDEMLDRLSNTDTVNHSRFVGV